MLTALDDLLSPSQEIAIVGPLGDARTQELLHETRRHYLPHTALALKEPDSENPLPLLEGRTVVDGLPAAYVCENFACKLAGDRRRSAATSVGIGIAGNNEDPFAGTDDQRRHDGQTATLSEMRHYRPSQTDD